MNNLLKIGHFLGLAVFVGSIFGHVLLGLLADPSADPVGSAALILTPFSRDTANAAQTPITAGALPADYSELKRSEAGQAEASL